MQDAAGCQGAAGPCSRHFSSAATTPPCPLLIPFGDWGGHQPEPPGPGFTLLASTSPGLTCCANPGGRLTASPVLFKACTHPKALRGVAPHPVQKKPKHQPESLKLLVRG